MSSIRSQRIIIFYHSVKSGATRSILTLKKNKHLKFIKTPLDLLSTLKLIYANFKEIMQTKIIFFNGLGSLMNPSLLILSIFIKIFSKRVFIYWHESGWIWRGLVPEKKVIGSILFHKIIRYVIKNSINITVSKYSRKWLNSKFQLKNTIELLYNTINLKKILKLSQFEGYDYSEKKYKVIMALGAATERKGFHIFIDVAEKAPSYYKFIWIGKDEELNKDLAEKIDLINQKNNYEKIEVFDYNPNPFPLIKNSDIFFLPSLDEPFGLVYLEAFILGKFVIAPTTTGFSEIIEKNSKLALIYKNTREIIELLKSDAIDSYIRNFKEERLQLAKKFDNDRFNKKILELFRKYTN